MMLKVVVAILFFGLAPFHAIAEGRGTSPLHQASLVQQKSPLYRDSQMVFDVNIKAIGATDSGTFEVDPRVAYLTPKLKRLPFTSYKLLYESSESLGLLMRHKVALADGQTLCLRPVDSNGNQITMWLKWKGDDGMSILDTRVNFALDEPMIVGIEGKSEGTAGTVLAISVTPKS